METCLISILFDYSGTLIILLYLSDEKSGHEWNIISQFPCMCNDGKFFGKEEVVEEMFKSSKGKT